MYEKKTPIRDNFEESFAQYVDVMTDLAADGRLDDVMCIGNAITHDALALDLDEETTGAFIELMKVMSFSQGRCAHTEEEIRKLLHDIDNAFYYDEEMIEVGDYPKAFILRAKAETLYKLSCNDYLDANERSQCLDRAISCIDKAAKLFSSLYETEDDMRITYFNVCCSRAIIHSDRDINYGRKLSIQALSLIKPGDDKTVAAKRYHEITEELFEGYNPVWIHALKNKQDFPKEVKDEIKQLLFKNNKSSEEDDYLAKTFIHAVRPKDRQSILIVDDIYDAAGVDFDKIQQVFTKDLVPYDIKFDGDIPPISGMVYVLKKRNSSVYVPSYEYKLRVKVNAEGVIQITSHNYYEYVEPKNAPLSITQKFLLWVLWQMKCLPDKPHIKSQKVIGKFFEELEHYVCDSYSQVVEELYQLAQDWNYSEPLVDGHGNMGTVVGFDTATDKLIEEKGADAAYTEVRLSTAGVDYIKSYGIDNMTATDLLKKHNIFKP